MVNCLPGIFYAFDVHGHFLCWNDNLEKLSGCTAAEIARMHPLDFIAAGHRHFIAQKIEWAFEHGEATAEADFLCKDGGTIPHFFTGKRSEVNGKVCIMGMGVDISDRKRSEIVAASLAAIVESSEDAIIGKDLEGVITSWNRSAERMFGYRAEDVVGQAMSKLLSPDLMHEEKMILDRVRRGERIEPFETFRLAQDGRRLCVSISVSPIKDGSGNIIGASKIIRDITEQKRAAEALRESRERLEMVTQLSEIGLWLCDVPWGRMVWNAKAKEHFGLAPDAEINLDLFFARLHPEDRERAREAIERSIAKGTTYDVDYRTIATGTAKVRWIRAIGRAFYDSAGNPVRFDGITVDVTAHKEVEESLRSAKAEIARHAGELEERVAERTARLQESVQSLEGVLYHVAHDLRAPLRAMQGFTTILLEEYAPKMGAEGEDYARRVSASAGRMDKLIQDLLAYGRLTHIPVTIGTLDLGRELGMARGRLELMVRERRAVISMAGFFPKVRADAVILGEVLHHLLHNALTFVPAGVAPQINIRAESISGGRVRLWFEDNGVGIDPEHHERIFRVFERLQLDNVYNGTGIGLAIVRKGAERMGGTAGVESRRGEGSRFWVELQSAEHDEH